MATVVGRVTIALLALSGACVRGGYEVPAQRVHGDLASADRWPRELAQGEQADLGTDLPHADAAPLGAFGVPVTLAALNSAAADDDPSLTGDQLEIYFASYRPGGPGPENLYRSTRSTTASEWSAPELVAELNSTSYDCTPRVSLDGLSLRFASMRSGNFELYVSTRASRSSLWGPPALEPALASGADDYGGSLSESGLTLAFYSDRGGDHDLYLATRATLSSPWGAPVELSELSTAFEEGGPQLDATEKVIFFFSTRPGGKGDRDLWTATRASPTGLFGAPTPIVELNTADEESDLWISPDLRTLYFGGRGTTDLDLYRATR